MSIARIVLALVFVFGLSTGIGGSAALAQSQPDLNPVDQVAYVSPERCTGDEADLERIAEISGDALATPDGTVEGQPLFEGDELANETDADAVRELTQTMLACINANDPLRFLSLFTDDFFRHYSADVVGIIEAAGTEEGTEPLDDGYALVYESAVYQLEDGRLIYAVALAWVEPDLVTDDVIATDLIQIAAIEIDGAWKIDELRAERFEDPNEEPDCGPNCATPDSEAGVEGEGYAGWIMPVEIAEASQPLFVWGETVTGFFEPTEAEIAEAENVFVLFLNQDDWAEDTGLLDSVSGHWRQYFGYETESGRLLVVNGFCDALGQNPAEQVIAVEDGGACFWYAIYNLDTHRWERISINGEA